MAVRFLRVTFALAAASAQSKHKLHLLKNNHVINTVERPPKMKRLSGHLRGMVVYKNRTTGNSSEKRSSHIYFVEDDLLHAMSKLGRV